MRTHSKDVFVSQEFENFYTMPGYSDDFFRYVDRESTVIQSDGETDSPIGYFELMQIESEDISTYVSEYGDPWASSNIKPGWYLVVTNSDGIIFAYSVGQPHQSERPCRAAYDALERAFEEWTLATDEEA